MHAFMALCLAHSSTCAPTNTQKHILAHALALTLTPTLSHAHAHTNMYERTHVT